MSSHKHAEEGNQEKKQLKRAKREERLQGHLGDARESLAKARAQFQRAEERIQKRAARVDLLEQKLLRAEQTTEQVAPNLAEEAETMTVAVQIQTTATPEEAHTDEVARVRAAAEEAGEEACAAVERVYEMMERMETYGYGRHLAAELARLQDEAERARQQAYAARNALDAVAPPAMPWVLPGQCCA
ncbi:MAG TPA: hypothetical protein VHZ51_08090 [Ktedonobacteraceae bacterium]|jgi:hypothetical protein|nr:hypothetical protein [Ktedonobacteraceae bacterium]